MGSEKRILAALGAMLFATGAQAQIYMCKDANGRTLTSDRPIPECSDRSMKVLDNQGVARREIAAPLTPEQKRQRQEEEEKRKAAAAAEEEQKREDRALMARYKSEADIEAARKRSLEQVAEHIKMEESGIAAAEKRLKGAQVEADALKKAGKPLSARLQQRLDDNKQAIADGRKHIGEREKEMAPINAKYDQTLKRFRELTAPKQAAAPAK